ncbi:hypothetical protein, partial [Citrobacter freundii]|uniref:hypothetical protein n=1 Tax=Citrobacter freundii TaxID=546 RepID=UPI0024E09DA1
NNGEYRHRGHSRLTQLIARYELAIGRESTATLSLLPGSPGFFLPGEKHANNNQHSAGSG